jgi:glyoxylase-like metal-dependent hydrolase (beta-lactamase superfamily II)
MHELRPGLWWWQAPHPDWNERQRWPREVSSYAIDDGKALVLVDPNAVPDALLELASHRQPIVLLTAPWHERDTRTLVDRLGATVYTPPADTAADLVRKFHVTPEQAGAGSPDLEWLRSDPYVDKAHFYGAGDSLPLGIQAFLGREENDLVLWFDRANAVISGDTLVDFGKGFGINEWLRGGVTRAEVAARLRPLLDLPVEVVASAHGKPIDRAALERALA